MPKTRYDSHVKPFLSKIQEMVRQGADQKEIAEKLQVGYSTFRDYVRLGRGGDKRYTDLAEVMERGAEEPDAQVEASLYRKCTGYTVQVTKHYKVKTVEYDEDTGRRLSEREELKEVLEDVYVPADTNAIIFYLTNRKPERWQRTPLVITPEETRVHLEPDVEEVAG